MTIVVLGLITGGLEDSIQTTLNSGSADITVMPDMSNGHNMAGNGLDQSYVDKIKGMANISDAAGMISIESSNQSQSPSTGSSVTVSESPIVEVYGLDSNKLNLQGISSVNGSVYNPNQNEIIIGKTLAKSLNKSTGDTINLFDRDFKITGIYETGSMGADSSAYTSLETAKNISNTTQVGEILVKTTQGSNNTVIGDQIEEQNKGNLTTITKEQETQMLSQVTGILDAASLGISLLAILIGSIGIVNTMVMTVYERTKEIGVLKAVGWSNSKIYKMIIGETLVLTIVSAIIGSLFGIILGEIGQLIMQSTASAFKLAFKPETFILAFGIAIIVGIIGGIYPAYKASKLPPTEALRYE